MKSIPKKILLAFCSLVVACGIAELALRVFVEQEVKRLAIYDPDLGWRGRPHGSGIYVRQHDGIRVPFTYNNYGFNDEDIVPKSKGGTRVVILGDSFVESLEVPAKSIFHHLVQAELKAWLGPDADVVALCSQGYSTAQELRAFRKFRDIVDGDIALVVFYGGNDFEDNLRHQFAYLDDQRTLVLPENQDSALRVRYLGFKRWLYESSHLVFLAKNMVEAYTSMQLGDSSKEAGDQDEEYKTEITKQLLLQLRTDVEAAGLQFGVVIVPATEEIRENVETYRTDAIRGFCESEGIPHADLAGVLSKDDYFQVDFHFNESGHRKTANAILELLRSQFGLDPAVSSGDVIQGPQ